MPEVEAARHLGFSSATTLKNELARLGLVNERGKTTWPYRRRSTLRGIVTSLQARVRGGRGGSRPWGATVWLPLSLLAAHAGCLRALALHPLHAGLHAALWVPLL